MDSLTTDAATGLETGGTIEFQIVRTTDPTRPFFWRIVGDQHDMMTFSSARYRTKADCLVAIDVVRRGAAAARVVDLTS